MANYDLHIINPRKKTSRKKTSRKKTSRKKTSRKKPSRKKATSKKTTNMAGKKKATRRRRRRNPAPAPGRRRRSNRTPNPRRRRRRTSNPLGLSSVPSQVKQFIPRLAGKLAVAFVVKKLGYDGSSWGGQTSQLMGDAWSWKQYLGAIGIALYGGKLFGKFINSKEFAEGAWDMILTKAIWTDGISRSQWAVNQFGDGMVQVAPGTGQSWINQGGQYVNLQGGTLVDASALDGGTLVEASALDGGTLVDASALDGDDVVYPGEVVPVSGNPYDASSTYG